MGLAAGLSSTSGADPDHALEDRGKPKKTRFESQGSTQALGGMMAANSLGRFIRECRESLGFTSRKVEEMTRTRPGLVAISHSNLLAIEKGSHVPTFDKIV